MDGTRNLRHVRHHLRRPPRPPPNPHLERLRLVSATKRLPPPWRRRARGLQDRHTRHGLIIERALFSPTLSGWPEGPRFHPPCTNPFASAATSSPSTPPVFPNNSPTFW